VVINRDRVLARPGRAHVLVFFATWCTNCEDELFLIKEARQKVEEAGVDLVLVACGEDAETTMPWLRERGLDGETVLIDRFGQTAKAFGVDDNGTMKLPRTVVLGVKGTVLASFGNEGKRIVKRVLGSIRMDPALRK
jgi:peroxiredoxin